MIRKLRVWAMNPAGTREGARRNRLEIAGDTGKLVLENNWLTLKKM